MFVSFLCNLDHIYFVSVAIVRQSAIGSFQGFYQFIYYSWLDKVFSGVSLTIVAKKVLLDEVLIGPISLAIFFLCKLTNLLEFNFEYSQLYLKCTLYNLI